MCGIVGYVGKNNAVSYLLNGLKKLEYRGYDSSGILINKFDNNLSSFQLYKKSGKIQNLISILPENLYGNSGIGHTRWATHGTVTDYNAHPFIDMTGNIAVVHNGIIENSEIIKKELIKNGIKFQSETDSEVIPNLIEKYYNGDLAEAVQKALKKVIGTYALAIMHKNEPNKIVVAKLGGPLAIGISDENYYIASDVNAIVGNTSRVIYLNDGDIVELSSSGIHFLNIKDNNYKDRIEDIKIKLEDTEKSGFSTYMEKEIFEQVSSIKDAIAGRIDFENSTAKLSGFEDDIFKRTEKICMMSAGTSLYASIFGSLLFEQISRIFSYVEYSSELRYKNPIVKKDDVYIAVSQSGETADTIYAIKEIKEKGGKVFSICNVVASTIARESENGAYIHAGPEIAVAATKSFSNTIMIFYLIALKLARQRGMSKEEGKKFIEQILKQSEVIEQVLLKKDQINTIAKKYSKYKDFLFLGRGFMYPIAMEGALKLKEISYIHAESFAAGEIKHGSISLINENMPSMFLVPNDHLREKVISNIKEIKARKGKVIAVGIEGDTELENIVDDFISVPKLDNPIFYALPITVILQLFALYVSQNLDRDIDQPRNLAKSVTVE